MEQNIASFREIATGNGGIEERLNAIAQLLWVAKENRKSARVDTSRFYVRNTSKSKRQQLNDNAVNILSQIRAGTLEAKDLSEEQKIALAHYSGCGGGFTGIRAPGVDVMPGTLFHSVLDSVETPANITAPRMGAYARAMWNGRGGARAMAWLLDSVSEAERPAEFFGRLRSVSNGDY